MIRRKLEIIFPESPICQFLYTIFSRTGSTFDLSTVRRLRFDSESQDDRTVVSFQNRTIRCPMLQVMQAVFKPLRIEPVVVIGKSTQSIELRTVSIGYNRLASVGQAVNRTRLHIELSNETVTTHRFNRSIRFIQLHLSGRSRHGTDGRTRHSFLQQNLFLRRHKSFFSPRHIIFKKELHLYKIFGIILQLVKRHRY